jgi:hypothetical protein
VLALLLILLSLFTTPLASAAGVRATATGVRASDLVVSVGMVIQRTRVDDGRSIVAEFNGAGTMTARFVYGTRPQVPDYMIKGGALYRILTDHLGSVRLVVRLSDGVIVQQLAYDPWGDVEMDTKPGFQPFGFHPFGAAANGFTCSSPFASVMSPPPASNCHVTVSLA